MNKYLLLIIVCLVNVGFGHCQNNIWRVELALNDRLNLPFFLEQFTNSDSSPSFRILNGKEKINLSSKQKKDSLQLNFLEMDSYLMISLDSLNNFRGYWQNNIKGQRIPLHGVSGNFPRFHSSSGSKPLRISEKYRVTFSLTDDPWTAIGLFEQKGQNVSGTFLTETGDFRFLSGNVYGNEFYLSCFDGSHAFLFTAKINDEALMGRFYSGTSYQTDWEGVADKNARLRSPNKLTYIIDSTLDLNDVKVTATCGFKKKLGAFKSPVTIIQIMGTWCPNCLDETNYYKALYEKYKSQGLEIKSIAFEYGATKRIQRKKLKRFANKAEIPYPVYLGGAANKKTASVLFPMLNEISSFPTSLFLNENGDVVFIHTGFNGPGTGDVFENYKKETEGLIENLLK
ncbi:TlpA family protein disulfide reductase [Crocinitomicaceae bacterium]|nr:TlpA family protein disulfide reductase [Crocinitomicaceae bacterium]